MSNLSTFCITVPTIPVNTITPVANVATIDVSVKRVNKLTITDNTTINPTNKPATGDTKITILDIFNGISKTLTFHADFEWAGGVVPTWTANWDRIILITIDGNKVWCHSTGTNYTP
jgi:hypothetical protein